MTEQPSNTPVSATEDAAKVTNTAETAALAVGTNEAAALTAVTVAKSAAAAAADAAATAAAKAGVQFEVKRAEAVVEVAVKTDNAEVNAAEDGDGDNKEAGEGETEQVVEEEKEDDSWYGAGPADEEVTIVREALGEEICEPFIKAVRQLNGASDDVSRVLEATASFVTALKRIPEEKQTSVAFGIVALPYGRALVRYIELEGSGSTAVVGKIIKAMQSAVAGASTGAKVSGDDAEEDGEAADEEGEEDIEDKDGDEEDIDSAWALLEVARLNFQKEGQTLREAECRVTLGELLMACDEGKQASGEFEEAAKLFTDGRRKAECFYKQYLALRTVQKSDAVKALEEAVKVYEGAGAFEDVLTDMKRELADMLEASEMDKKDAEAKQDVPVEVVAVRPKRKRDVEAETAVIATATATEVEVPDAPASNGAAEGETNGKKARVD